MNIEWETFQDAYLKADNHTKEIIDSGVIAKCVSDLAPKYALPQNISLEITKLYAGKVLGIITDKNLVDALLILTDVAQSQAILNELTAALAEREENVKPATERAATSEPTSNADASTAEVVYLSEQANILPEPETKTDAQWG